MSLLDIGNNRGLLPFSGVMFTIFLVVSMSVHFSCNASPIRMAVSLRSCRSVLMIFRHDAIRMSMSCSVGM